MNDNQQKFADMVQQNKSTIYTVCYMFSKDQDEVNDLFQEVLIRLWQGFANFEGRSDVKTWIYRVALNTCITLDRKKRRHHKERVYMGDDLFSGNERDSQQAEMLHKRIIRLQPLDRAICSALARGHQLRGDWCHHRHYGKERERSTLPHPRTTQKLV